MTEPRQPFLLPAAGLILFATLLVYANTLTAPFIFDDAPAITNNPSLLRLTDALSPPANAGSAAGRPLVNLSFALNHAAGGFSPRGYHAVNLALHGLAALTLFGLVRRTLLQPALRERHGAHALPLAAAIALLWAVHPLQTESVACAVHRAEVMGGLFYLLTVYGAIRALHAAQPRNWIAAAIAACFAGVASKEVVATAPLVVLAYDCLFAAGSLREAWRRRGTFYLSLTSSWLLLGWLMVSTEHRAGSVGFGLGVSAWDYLLTQCHAIVLYLRLTFWPHPLVLDYGTDIVTRFTTVLPQFGLLVLLAGATLLALRRRWVAAFAGVWFFVILAPSSSIVPLTTQPVAEHRMYLPLAAVIVLVVLALHARLGRVTLLLAGVAATGLGFTSVRRNAAYGSAITIWTDTVTHAPANPRAHAHLAESLLLAGREDEALREYRTSLHLLPEAGVHYNIGLILLRREQVAEAAEHLAGAVRLRPAYPEARSNLGVALVKLQREPEALIQFEEAVRLQPDYPAAHYNLASLLLRAGRPAEAVPHYERVLELMPGNTAAAQNLALARQAAGRR